MGNNDGERIPHNRNNNHVNNSNDGRITSPTMRMNSPKEESYKNQQHQQQLQQQQQQQLHQQQQQQKHQQQISHQQTQSNVDSKDRSSDAYRIV